MRRLSRSIVFLVIAALLAACSSKPATEPTKTPDSAPSQKGEQTDPNKPVVGGSFTKSLNYGDPGNLDPIMKSDVAARMVSMNILDTLIKYDPVAKAFVRSIAEDYSISSDGLTYTFKIRKGVKFHNGRELKAADVKYSFERPVDPKSASVAVNMFDGVSGVEAFKKGEAQEISGIVVKGDYDLEIKLDKPKVTFLMDISNPAAGIVPKEEVERLGPDFGQQPVGSGPFKFGSWSKDDKIVLKAFTDYHAGRPYLDEVVFRIMKEEQTRDAEFQAGTLDAMTIGEALYKRYSADPERSKGLVEVPELFTRAIHFNTTVPPFDNVKVRQAINYAIDKQPIVEKVLNNKAFVATGVLQSSSPAFNPNLKGYEYNPERAKKLLKEAGYENGFEFEVLVTSVTAKWMEAMNTYLNPLGINGKINQMEGATLLGRARSGDYQAVIFSTGGDVDPVSFLGRFQSKNHGSAGNVTLYTNAEVDRLLDEAGASGDQAKRIQLAQQAEKIIVEEAPWFIFNYNKAVMIAQPRVHGLQPVPTDIDFQDLSKVWISKK